jgi:hypothetical protein
MKKVIKNIIIDGVYTDVLCVKTLNKMIKRAKNKNIEMSDNLSFINNISYSDKQGNHIRYCYTFPIGSYDIIPNTLNCIQFEFSDNKFMECYFNKMVKIENNLYYVIDQIIENTERLNFSFGDKKYGVLHKYND